MIADVMRCITCTRQKQLHKSLFFGRIPLYPVSISCTLFSDHLMQLPANDMCLVEMVDRNINPCPQYGRCP